MAGEYVAKNLKPRQVLDEVQIQQLVDGAKSAHRVRLEEAGNLGHLGHAWCEAYMKGYNPATPVNEDLRGITEAFLKFVDKYDIEPMQAERKLYSREMNVAGTTDLTAMFDGSLAILDYKTGSSGIYNEAFIQLGAYSSMYFEETGDQPQVHVVVNITKAGELNVGICEDVARSERAFRDAWSLNNALAQVEKDRKWMVQRIS